MFALLNATIFQSGGAANAERVYDQRIFVVYGSNVDQITARDQRLFVLFGPNTDQMTARDQRLFAVFDSI